MDNLVLSFRVVAPLFLIMVLGYLLRNLKIIGQETISQMSKITFRVFLSTQVFNNIYHCAVKEVWDSREVLINLLLMVLNFLLAVILARWMEKDDRRFTSMAQGLFQNSFITFGIPIVSAVYGSGSTGMAAMLSALIVPLKNVFVVAHMSSVNGKTKNVAKIVLNVLKNPFFISGCLGFIVNLSGLKLPYIIEQSISELAKAATPIALLLLGASLSFGTLKNYRKYIILGTILRLFIIPAVLIPVAILFGLRGPSLLSALVMLAAPNATSAHVIAREMGADSELASGLTVVSSAFSSFSFFLLIFILKTMGYL